MPIRNADGICGQLVKMLFDELLNVDDGREAQLSDSRIPGVNQC